MATRTIAAIFCFEEDSKSNRRVRCLENFKVSSLRASHESPSAVSRGMGGDMRWLQG